MTSKPTEHEYYLWRSALTPEGGSAVLSDKPAALDQLDIKMDEGKPIGTPVPADLRMRRKPDEEGPMTDFIRTYGKWALIVSDKLKTEMLQAGVDNVDWYPLVIDDEIEKQELNYWCGNIIGVVDCIDTGRSVLDEYDLFRRMWIDTRAAKEQLLFRLMGYEEIHILVHRRLVEAIRTSGCAGVDFVPANGFCDLEADPLDGEEDEEDDTYQPWV